MGADLCYLRLLYHLNVQHSHMLPYSTLYVAIVTLQCFSGIYIRRDVWCKCVPCSKLTNIPLLNKINAHRREKEIS